MAAPSRFAAAISAFSVLSAVSAGGFPDYPKCIPTTTTVFATVTVTPQPTADVKPDPVKQYTPPADFTYPGVKFPTFSPEDPNPNGPYYNPNNWIPEPITWPGLPTKGQVDAPPYPTKQPCSWGGPAKSRYGETHWCEKGSDAKPGLPQNDTNGDSQWGLPDCPRLFKDPFTTDTDVVCGKFKDTGVVRKYKFSVGYATIAPDGVKRNSILINNQFPGPLIEANWGDWIEVEVVNDLPYDAGHDGEPTAIHWHGLLQSETPYYDGVPSVQQCPIAPKKSLTYKFRASQVGTSWYHSHYSAQYAGGAYGPIVIHGPATAEYDEDIGPVIVSDWFHKDYFTVLKNAMNGTIPLSDNALINGKMNFPCANTTAACTPNAGISKFKFTPGKKYRLRLINTSAEATMKFTIDGHDFLVFANDFQPVKPYTTKVITLGVGQRSDIVVEAVGKAGDSFWMRSEMGNVFARDGCSFTTGVSTQAVAGVYYDGADINSLPTTTSELTAADKNNCLGDALEKTQSFCVVPLADEKDVEEVFLNFTFTSNGTNLVWSVNNSTFRANMNQNLLENVIEGNYEFEKQWNVLQFDSSKKAIRFVMANNFQTPHPMHLHGHDFNVLAAGVGTWDRTIVNPENTQVRDVQNMLGMNPQTRVPSYLVVQFNKDSPGIWPMHCHIAWHVSQGLYVNILERPEDIKYQIPGAVKQTCDDYDAWTHRNVPNQIDSGL